MKVTELEYVALTMRADRNNVLQSRFGPGWVELLDTPQNQWAFDALRGMRAGTCRAGEPHEDAERLS